MPSRTSEPPQPAWEPGESQGPEGFEEAGISGTSRTSEGLDEEAGDGGPPLRDTAGDGLKIVIVGGFGVGKTTLVGAVSEIRPLSTEETMSRAGVGIDDPAGAVGGGPKSRTTVAFDFGRITLDDEMVLYLFGAPGQERFWFLWDRLFSGTLGAVVLVDTRRIADSWYAIDRLEHHGLPFIVARNNFGPPQHSLDELREALSLPARVPLVDCDARLRSSAKAVLVALMDHLLALSSADPRPAAVPVPVPAAVPPPPSPAVSHRETTP